MAEQRLGQAFGAQGRTGTAVAQCSDHRPVHQQDELLGQLGVLVTEFAIGYAVLAPVLATVAGHWPRRRVMPAALGLFVLGNAPSRSHPPTAGRWRPRPPPLWSYR
jgi:MFS family permease